MNIDSIGMKQLGQALQSMGTDEAQNGNETGFMKQLERQIASTNDLLNVADKAGQEIAIGKSENLHSAMIAMEKAETSLKFLVQVRNKAMEAYNDVLRMQV